MTIELNARIPAGPLADKWDKHRFEMKLVNPANKRKYTVIVVGSGLAGGAAAATLSELGYNVRCYCYQDSPRRAHSHRRAGRHQRGEELPERRRQHPAAVLRHDQGRRLPRARGERVPARADQREHHRPVRRAGRAVRARVRRPARQPLVRRRAGLAHLLRARPDGPAAAARRVPGAGEGDREGRGDDVPARRDARPHRRERSRARHRRARRADGHDRAASRRRGRARDGRLRQRLLPVDEREGLQRDGDLARVQARRGVRQSVLHADPSDVHPRRAASISRS